MKPCRKCRLTKDYNEFNRDSRSRDGLTSACSECIRDKTRRWYRKNQNRCLTPVTEKRCSKCLTVKGRDLFRSRPCSIDGLDSWCRECKNELDRSRIRRDPEINRMRVLKWQSENRDKVNDKSRRRRSTLRGRYDTCKRSARFRGIEFDISFEQYESIVSSGLCHYCGGALPPRGGGLDRVDNSAGYLSTNVVSCCSSCNETKGRFISYGEMVMIMQHRGLFAGSQGS